MEKSFEKYLKSFENPDDSTFDWMEFLDIFRREIYENPEKFTNFFDSFNRLIEKSIPKISPEMRNKYTLEYFAVMSVLADHDSDGELSESFLELRCAKWFSSFYNNPENYGHVMKSFSGFVGLEGESLEKHVFENSTIH